MVLKTTTVSRANFILVDQCECPKYASKNKSKFFEINLFASEKIFLETFLVFLTDNLFSSKK